jgi:KEOPS complex subunit Cgi121
MKEKHEELNENIIIVGFSNVKIDDTNRFLEQIRKENKISIQFFEAKYIAGTPHLYFAAINAMNAFIKKRNISKNLAIETLLFASGQRQIKKAFKMLGIKKGTSEMAILLIPKNPDEKNQCLHLIKKKIPGKLNNKILELTNNKIREIKKLFQISDKEFRAKLKKDGLEKEALIDLVIERMAILNTKS